MAVVIKNVERFSKAYFKGIRAGDTLISVNSHEINDVLDYRFRINDSRLSVSFRNGKGTIHIASIKKAPEEDIGLEFETYLMDSQRHCANNCIFCFINQLPEGLRKSLYFKDDDSRLSFLFGNYITLTNMDEKEIDRIIEMHISPVNISVHTMNPVLRVEMMKNPRAGDVLSYIARLAEAGIKLNTQLVLCPGINDGKELEYSLNELRKYYPAVQSIAAVPVGLTCHRDNLPHIDSYSEQTASEVIDIIDDFNAHFSFEHGCKIAYAADEFYLKAKRQIPSPDYYDDYPQLENGVGMWALLRDEFISALADAPDSLPVPRKVCCVTGKAAYPLISELAETLSGKVSGLEINVFEAGNSVFGSSVTVAGLLPGKDILEIAERPECDAILIPAVSLRREGDLFIDDLSLQELRESVRAPVIPVSNDGAKLMQAMLGAEI